MLKEINTGIYSWKNYVPQSTLDYYQNLLNNLSEDSWYIHCNVDAGDISGKFLDGKLSFDIVERPFLNELIDLFGPDKMWIYCHGNFLRLKTGEGSGREDSYTKILSGYAPFIQKKIAIYMSEFSGGEIVFPEINFEYKPEAGELLVFDIDIKLDHYTKPVTSGTRYVYMDYVIQHPGYYMP